jgi:acetyl esterase/lipase
MEKYGLVFFVFMLATTFSSGQKTYSLYEGMPPNSKPSSLKDSTVFYGKMEFVIRVITPELTAYLPEKAKATGFAVIICPGGGYSGLAIQHEGHEIARRMQANGIAGFVLKYRLPNAEFVSNKAIVPLQDAQRAIQLVRENAAQWAIDPKKIGILGNSAGGHLAATASTHFGKETIVNPKKTSLRPDFMVLNYPVISFADSITHYGSRFNLIGQLPNHELQLIFSDWQNSEKRLKQLPVSDEKIFEYSNEQQVRANTPPAFVTHAIDDDVVLVQNSLLFIAALQQHQVPVASFFYAKGGHGYGLNNPTSKINWADSCITWILKLKQ